MKRMLPLLLIALASLAACKKEETAASATAKIAAADTPVAAVQAQVEALRAGQFSSALLASIPPSFMDQARAQWQSKMAEPVSDEDRASFAEMMGDLTKPEAEAEIFAKLEPELVKFKETAALQMPMYVGMGRGLLAQGIQQREDLSAAQKTQAMASIDAFAKWAESAEFADSARAQRAIGHVCQAARDLKLNSIDEMRALSFDEAVKRGDVLFVAFKNILAAYDFKVDDVLASVETELVSQTGDQAKVKVNYTMFATPLNFETDLVNLDGGWFGKDSVENMKKELEKPEVAVEGDVPAQG
jgi:hypothetical protein